MKHQKTKGWTNCNCLHGMSKNELKLSMKKLSLKIILTWCQKAVATVKPCGMYNGQYWLLAKSEIMVAKCCDQSHIVWEGLFLMCIAPFLIRVLSNITYMSSACHLFCIWTITGPPESPLHAPWYTIYNYSFVPMWHQYYSEDVSAYSQCLCRLRHKGTGAMTDPRLPTPHWEYSHTRISPGWVQTAPVHKQSSGCWRWRLHIPGAHLFP